jgi:hypothetical protein
MEKTEKKNEISFFAKVYNAEYNSDIEELKKYKCLFIMIPKEISELGDIKYGNILEVKIRKVKKEEFDI